MFGNYTKKINKLRGEMEDSVFEMKNAPGTSGDIAAKLTDFLEKLRAFPEVSSKEDYKNFREMSEILKDINRDIVNGSGAAIAKCETLQGRLKSQGSKKEKSRVHYDGRDVIRHVIGELQSQKSDTSRRLGEARRILSVNEYDAAAYADVKTLEISLSTLDEQLKYWIDASTQSAVVESVNRLSDTEKAILSTRGFSDEQFQASVRKLDGIRERAAERHDSAQQGVEALTGGTSPDGAKDATGAVNYGETYRNSQTGGVNYAQMAGVNADAVTGSGDAFGDLEDVVKEIAQMDRYYELKIKEAQKSLSAAQEKAKSLLLKRRDASGAECVLLDGDIDNARIAMRRAENTLKRYANERAKNSEYGLIAQEASDSEDIKRVKDLCDDVQGFIDRSPEIAMYIKSGKIKANEELDITGTTVAVADSVDIETGSYTGGNVIEGSGSLRKDESKYADLEQELGLL